MRKVLVVLVLFCLFAGLSWSEVDRTLYTRENRFPELYKPEIGVVFEYRELDRDVQGHVRKNSADLMSTSVYSRLQVLDGLTFDAAVPFNRYSSSNSSKHNGLGDITVGASFLAFEDVLDYPYIIPHASHTFDTGDEDKNLGAGESRTTVGVTIGTVTHNVVHWLADLSYRIRDKADNSYMVSAGLIWDISKQLSVLGEARYIDLPDAPSHLDGYGLYYTGGMTYDVTDKMTLGVYGTATSKNTEEDVIITIKAGFGF